MKASYIDVISFFGNRYVIKLRLNKYGEKNQSINDYIQ